MVVRLILHRLLLSLGTLWVVSFLIFWAVEWLPGDTAALIVGREATPEAVRALRERLHLGDAPMVRYWRWLSAFTHGDWGRSLAADRPVKAYVLPRLRNTLVLTGLALSMYVALTVIIGITSALFYGGFLDTWLSILTLVGISMPEFVVGIFLMLLLAVVVPLFPPLALTDQVHSLAELLHTLTLPALALTAVMTAYATRMMRSNLVEVLESEYVRMAILKGLPKVRVVFRHALPNAVGPTLTITALNVAWLIGGVVVVERVFTFPGLGRLLVDSISFHDFPVVEAIAVLLAGVYVVANLLADIAVVMLNPRLRTG